MRLRSRLACRSGTGRHAEQLFLASGTVDGNRQSGAQAMVLRFIEDLMPGLGLRQLTPQYGKI